MTKYFEVGRCQKLLLLFWSRSCIWKKNFCCLAKSTAQHSLRYQQISTSSMKRMNLLQHFLSDICESFSPASNGVVGDARWVRSFSLVFCQKQQQIILFSTGFVKRYHSPPGLSPPSEWHHTESWQALRLQNLPGKRGTPGNTSPHDQQLEVGQEWEVWRWSSLAGAGGSTRNLVFAFASDVKSIFSEWFYRIMKWKRGRTIFDICSAIEQPQPISYFLLFLSFLSRVSRAIACCTASPHGLLPLTGASGSQLHLGPTNILPLLLLGHLHHLLLGPQQTASLPPGHLHQVAQLGPPLLHLRQGAGGALAHHAFGRRASGLFSFEFNCCWLCGKLQMW